MNDRYYNAMKLTVLNSGEADKQRTRGFNQIIDLSDSSIRSVNASNIHWKAVKREQRTSTRNTETDTKTRRREKRKEERGGEKDKTQHRENVSK